MAKPFSESCSAMGGQAGSATVSPDFSLYPSGASPELICNEQKGLHPKPD